MNSSIQLGTDPLESTFGLVRSMVGNDTNPDTLQMTTRLSHAAKCLNIFAKYPSWDRSPRRLMLRAIEDGNGDVSAKTDHIGPASWLGNVQVATVTLITSWNLGRQMIESGFPQDRGFSQALDKLYRKGYDMVFPFGRGDEEDSEDNNEEDKENMGSAATVHSGSEYEPPSASIIEAGMSNIESSIGADEDNSPLLNLEDHIAIEEGRNRKGKYDSFVEVNGKMVSKPRIIRELERAMLSIIPGSTDCLGRVAGLTRFPRASKPANLNKVPSTTNSDSILSGTTLFLNDPAVTLL